MSQNRPFSRLNLQDVHGLKFRYDRNSGKWRKSFQCFFSRKVQNTSGVPNSNVASVAVKTFRLSSSFAIMGDVMAGSSCPMAKPMSKISSHTAF